MWIVPSRSRPHNIKRLIKAFKQTLATTPVLLWLDADDPFLLDYLDFEYPPIWMVSSVVNRRPGLAEIYNDIFATNPDCDWYGFLADDVVPKTVGWDTALIRAAGKNGVAFGDDGINGENVATHPVVGGDLVREIGWLALPGLERLYIDTVWYEIGKMRDCLRYLPQIKVTHHHFSNRLAMRDAIYHKPHKAEDKVIYQAWKEATL